MLPKPPPPNSRFPVTSLRIVHPLSFVVQGPGVHGEPGFDQIPLHGEVAVPIRQCPHTVRMLRQKHLGIDRKRVPQPSLLDHATQHAPGLVILKQGSASVCYDRKEERPSHVFGTAVARHVVISTSSFSWVCAVN